VLPREFVRWFSLRWNVVLLVLLGVIVWLLGLLLVMVEMVVVVGVLLVVQRVLAVIACYWMGTCGHWRWRC
jgi:hypothetical protein